MTGLDAITAIKRKFRVKTDKALSSRIGVTVHGIRAWKARSAVTSRQFAEVVHKANLAGERNMQARAIRPVVEFFPIHRCESAQKAGYLIFSTDVNKGGTNRYLQGLREELESRCGVYIYFDSRGQAIYAGKARKQSLWREMNLAFNRERGEIQRIKRVNHPSRNQVYKTSNEKARQITDHVVPLHELASYFSAYEIADGMIGEVEAMLVRSFANDLLNKRMERFGQQRRRRSASFAA